MEDCFHRYGIVFFIDSVMCHDRENRDWHKADIIVSDLVVQGGSIQFFECGSHSLDEVYAQFVIACFPSVVVYGFLDVKINLWVVQDFEITPH